MGIALFNMARQHYTPYPNLQNTTDSDNFLIKFKAGPDNQGPYPSCTYFALSKAIVNGYFTGKFTAGKKINTESQPSVSYILLNLKFKDANDHNSPFIIAKNPTQFDKESILLSDVNNNLWKTKIFVSEVQSPAQELTEQNLNKNEYLIYYLLENNSLLCVYVNSISSNTQTVRCINSWGEKDSYPKIPIHNIKNLFKVTFVAEHLKIN